MSREASLGRQKITAWSTEIVRLAQAANGSGPLARGSLYAYRRRCGKPGCRCARGALHAGRTFAVSEGGRTRVVALRGLDLAELEAGVRAWRRTRAAMVAAFAELLRAVDRLEKLNTNAPWRRARPRVG